MKFQKPTGTVDYYPEEKAEWQFLADKYRENAKKYGFREIETPAFENLNLLTEKEGEEIKKQIFVMEKRGNKEEEFGLRFDITVPCARLFIQKQKESAKPVKWFYITRMWRYERPQAGRLREFYQFGVELFGSKSPRADAEIINLAVDTLKSLGLKSKDFFVRINNRKLITGLLLEFIPEEKIAEIARIIDKRDKVTKKDFDEMLKEAGVVNRKLLEKLLSINKLEELEKKDLNGLAREGLNALKEIFRYVDQKFVKLDLSAVRGLAYYTDTVFEIFDTKRKYRALCGGGRYDKMIEQFGGQPSPATGFGMGFSTVNLLLKDKGLFPKADLGPDYYIAIVNEKVAPKAVRIAQKLREKASVEVDLMKRNLGKQFEYANSLGAKNVIIIGERDLKEGKVTVKDMKTGKEKKVKIDNL